jgi:transposase
MASRGDGLSFRPPFAPEGGAGGQALFGRRKDNPWQQIKDDLLPATSLKLTHPRSMLDQVGKLAFARHFQRSGPISGTAGAASGNRERASYPTGLWPSYPTAYTSSYRSKGHLICKVEFQTMVEIYRFRTSRALRIEAVAPCFRTRKNRSRSSEIARFSCCPTAVLRGNKVNPTGLAAGSNSSVGWSMISKTTNRFSSRSAPERRAGAGAWKGLPIPRGGHLSAAEKIDASAYTRKEWLKKIEISGGRRAGLITAMAERSESLSRRAGIGDA